MVEAVKAYVIATVKRGTEHVAAQKIRKMKEVTEVLVTYGLYDLVCSHQSRKSRTAGQDCRRHTTNDGN